MYRAGGQKGGAGRRDVNVPLGVEGSEERKKRRNKEMKKEETKKEKFENLKKDLHAMTRRVGGFYVVGMS